jgi:hypothetical protein
VTVIKRIERFSIADRALRHDGEIRAQRRSENASDDVGTGVGAELAGAKSERNQRSNDTGTLASQDC